MKHLLDGWLWGIALVAGLLWLASTWAVELPANPIYSFGVAPEHSVTFLARVSVPLLNVLQAKSGLQLRFATAPDLPTFERRLAAGEYDFAYMDPYHYTVFHQHPGYQVFAKEKDRLLRGIVVVRQDAPYRELTDLRGQTLVFPAPAAFAATLLARTEFARLGIAITPRFVTSHDSVYLNVARGFHPAGGGIVRTFERLQPEVRDRLRILWTTQAFPPSAFAAHPRIPVAVVERLQQAMLHLDDDAAGRAALATIGFKAIATARDADYDAVRALHIELLDPLPED
ncbi:MAG: phosphate/phosphite/phosphonate ABC transporter substrate-binding protein [Candidatus Competibacteraceae bacterium]